MSEISVVNRQLINVIHHNKSRYDSKWFGKGQCIIFVEKVQLSDGRVIKRIVKNTDPTVRFHMTSPQFQAEQEYPALAYPADQCDEYEVPVDQLFKSIAQLTNQMPFFNETKGVGSNRRRQQLHGNRFLHGSDVNLSDAYIDRYMEHHKAILDKTAPLELAFADIEVDIIDHIGFPEEHQAPCPVSLISYFHKPTKRLTQFILRNTVRANALIKILEDDPVEHQIRVLAETNRKWFSRKRKDKKGNVITPLIRGDEDIYTIAGKAGLADIEGIEPVPELVDDARCTSYEMQWFDDEISLIKAFLHRVNEIDRPDVLAWWNMHFDIITLINRIRYAGENHEALFTPKDFGAWQLADYSEDTFNVDPTDNSDIFNVTAYTIYVDQMTLFAGIRKSGGKRDWSLNAVLESELGETKYQYDGELKDLPYRSFTDFLLYGAIDVVPMATLEEKTDDISMAYQISMTTRTRFHKILKKTICLRNLAMVFYREQGLILSNNRNRLKERVDTGQFVGAFVADPKLMGEHGIMIGGKRSSYVFDDVVDFDATALYPSIIMCFNIDAEGQLGRVMILAPNGEYVDASKFIAAMACGDMIELGRLFFNLPGINTLIEEVLDKE